MTRMSLTKIQRELAETLDQVASSGERVVIQRRKEDLAVLVPLADLELLEELEDRRDVEAADRALADPENRRPIPWEEAKKTLGLS